MNTPIFERIDKKHKLKYEIVVEELDNGQGISTIIARVTFLRKTESPEPPHNEDVRDFRFRFPKEQLRNRVDFLKEVIGDKKKAAGVLGVPTLKTPPHPWMPRRGLIDGLESLLKIVVTEKYLGDL